MGTSDGAVLAFRQLIDKGSRKLRYNIVLVSDGYTAAEIPLFRAQCKSFLRKLFWAAPFSSLRCTFNVFALEVSSTQSGIDDPVSCGDGTTGSGAMPATFFDSTMCGGGGVRRVISCDSGLVRNRVAGFLPEAHSILVLVNSTLHGGTTGDVAVFTAESGWEDTALHEFGHVLGLADEYECYACDGSDDGRKYDAFTAFFQYGPLDEPNVTDQTSLAKIPWSASISPATTTPTPSGSVPAGTVGLFEGAKYYALGLFRSEQTCKMRAASMPFCGVCRSAITSALGPWTPTTTCDTPVATLPSIDVQTWVVRKVLIGAGRGGYEVGLTATTTLPGAPVWSYRIDGGPWTANRILTVPVNEQQNTYMYNHSARIRAEVTVADLDYWVPATSAFTTVQADVPVALRQPSAADSAVLPDYGDPGNVEGTVTTSINLGGLKAGNGWISVGVRRYYTHLAVKVLLDGGYFGPDDDPAWMPKSIVWTPVPVQSSGDRAFYDVTFDANGLCWLNSDPETVVDPNVGFRVAVSGKDAIGQPFSATGRLVPTHIDYRQSISTIQVAKIPKWEWPVLIETPVTGVDVTVDGTPVRLKGDVLKIGDVEIPVRDALQ
jgi:hypothetical protein